METRRVDAAQFLDEARRVMANVAMNSVIIATARRLASEPDAFSGTHHVVGDPAIAGIFIYEGRTALVTDVLDDAGVDGIVAVLEREPGLTKMQANRPHIAPMVSGYSNVTGASTELLMEMGVFALEQVIDPPRPEGVARTASAGDRDQLIEWAIRFTQEAIPDDAAARHEFETIIDRRLDPQSDAGLMVWERNGQMVAMAGHSGDTGSGIRVNMVYTPPQHRGRGYASALCAAQAHHLLASGYDDVYLFTDLANPTSNAVYERIGYRRVGASERHGIVLEK